MADVLNLTDFDLGKNSIARNTYQETQLQWYIDKYEKHYLLMMLGVEEYGKFIADLTAGAPTSPEWVVVFEPLTVTINRELVTTRGMKEMLKGFIYFHYVRDNLVKQTTTGNVRTSSENGENISNTSALTQSRFNDSVADFKNIQLYIHDNDDDYPDWYYTELGYSLGI